ncbi:MAG: glycosyltransferase family 4 protein [Bacteroidia bacterium]|nr:glycosyltransferase family 4 protein [Bacteroidia bacterium]
MKDNLNIGFDAKRLFYNNSGLGNYSRWLVDQLSEKLTQNIYHLYTPGITEFVEDFNKENIKIHQPLGLMKRFWRSKLIKKDLLRDNIDIYHGLSNEIPYGIEKTKIKTVVTIHDLIFKTHPEFYNPIDVFIYDNKCKNSCLRADKIVAISNYTKSQIVEYYKINPEKIEVIYLDSLKLFYSKPDDNEITFIKNKYNLTQDFFLNVGAIGGRKNQFKILDAYSKIADQTDKNLVFAGKKNKNTNLLQDEIYKLKLDNRCKIISDVDNEELHKIYHASYATVYPSLIEGFGIPIIESYRSGKPVITSTGTSLEEIAGEAALLCNPNETESISESLLKITNNNIYNLCISKIPSQLLRLTPENTLYKYIQLYEKLR